MKWLFLLAICLGCSHKETPYIFKPYYAGYTDSAIVIVNGVSVEKYIKASFNNVSDTVIGFDMVSTTAGYHYYYSVTLSVVHPQSNQKCLFQSSDSSTCSINYYKACCYSNPDNIYEAYTTVTSVTDSNYVRLNLDEKNKKVSGRFQASLINSLSPFDTVNLRCDSFICKYN